MDKQQKCEMDEVVKLINISTISLIAFGVLCIFLIFSNINKSFTEQCIIQISGYHLYEDDGCANIK